MANQLYSLRLRSLGASYVSRNGRNDRILLPLLKSAAQISAERYYNRLFIDPFNIAQTTKRLDCLLHLLCICGSPLQETQNELPSGLRSPNRTFVLDNAREFLLFHPRVVGHYPHIFALFLYRPSVLLLIWMRFHKVLVGLGAVCVYNFSTTQH